MQAHFLFKALFSGIYVFFYNDNLIRAALLTAINLILLSLNAFLKPCSVDAINVFRNTVFIHASFSGFQSLNYLVWIEDENDKVKDLAISTLAVNIGFLSIIMILFYLSTRKSPEYTISTSFLDLEWQVSRGGVLNARVLEPLIALTLSEKSEALQLSKKYIGQLVWLISYPNVRVQFQSAWALANISLIDDDARILINESGGFKSLYEWYTDMDNIAQLESLACMANLTLSETVVADMVKTFKCIPFFLNIISSNKLKHSQFASIALANIAKKEIFREIIFKSGGTQVLMGCLLSNNYEKRRYGCLALANLMLSPTPNAANVFRSQGLVDRVIRMARVSA
jgi:hypothetical protein